MAKSDYISQNDDAFAAQIQAFKNAIGAYAATLGLTPAQVIAQAADADYFSYVIACPRYHPQRERTMERLEKPPPRWR